VPLGLGAELGAELGATGVLNPPLATAPPPPITPSLPGASGPAVRPLRCAMSAKRVVYHRDTALPTRCSPYPSAPPVRAAMAPVAMPPARANTGAR
jgi:hypothetical protein